MPNTLAHAGAQALASHTVVSVEDLRWVYLGCVVPDVPWILQRAAHVAVPSVDPYLLRSYVVIQASLLGCLLLSAAVALLARAFWRVWAILGGNAVLHLVLDAAQTKWGNGVLFSAPFSWELTNWGLFWPESVVTYVLTALGIGVLLWYWRSSLSAPPDLLWKSPVRWAGIGVLVAGYVLFPFFLLQAPVEADTHYLGTLQMPEDRKGRLVEFDRERYVETQSGAVIDHYGGRVPVESLDTEAPATVSLKGVFVSDDKVRATRYHVHASHLREYASYLGLALIAFVWVRILTKKRGDKKTREQTG